MKVTCTFLLTLFCFSLLACDAGESIPPAADC